MSRFAADWTELMIAAQAGDKRAYRRLLTELVPFLRAAAIKLTGRPDMADDIVQETLIALHRVRDSYDASRPFQPWLVSILRRRAIDAIRAHARRGGTHGDLSDADHIADPSGTAGIDQLEAAQVLNQALAELSPGQRQAIELLKLGELSLKEASKITGLSIPALKIATHRAVKALKAILERR